MTTLPNDLSNPADQEWAKMIIQEQNRVVQSAKYLYPIVDAVKNVDRLTRELVDRRLKQDDFDLLKIQEFELPEEPWID